MQFVAAIPILALLVSMAGLTVLCVRGSFASREKLLSLSKLIGSENPVVARAACLIGLFGLTAIWVSIAVGILGGWSGSGGQDDGQFPSWVNEYVKSLESLADLTENVNSRQEAVAALQRLKPLKDQDKAYDTELKELTIKEPARIDAHYGDRIAKAKNRIITALPRIQKLLEATDK